jgi:arabinan endo-1,5-alpha-L-arabinosidase
MLSKSYRKTISSLLSAVLLAGLVLSPNLAYAAKTRVSVHDPSIVQAGSTYYVFGSHIEAARSTDLKNWTKFTNGYTTPSNVLFGNLSTNLNGSFVWAGRSDGDAAGGYSVWAPFVFYDSAYVNSDGTKGAYLMYYCTSSTYKRSAIGFAVSKTIEGPYTYVNTVVYSGFTSKSNYDGLSSSGALTMNTAATSYSSVNTQYTNTNVQTLISGGTLAGARSGWFFSDGSFNNYLFPNAIDPALYYDASGKLWMMYGSWSGGIFALEINPATGMPKFPGADSTTSDGRMIDRYFGTKIAGGYYKSGEGPFVVYDSTSGYYYLYVTYGGLAASGGYNMRLFRSTSPTGPFVDAAGNNAVLPSASADNDAYGIKIMGNYKFSSNSVGYKSPGHNSSFIDSTGQMYLVYHTRFNDGTEGHEVRVHQMFKNEDGWPVTAPYEYGGDAISTSYTTSDIVGTYEFINHGTSTSSSMLSTLSVTLGSDGTVTGGVTGTWSRTSGTYYMKMVIGGVTYKGVFFKQSNESSSETKVMTFSAIGSNNQAIWGSK